MSGALPGSGAECPHQPTGPYTASAPQPASSNPSQSQSAAKQQTLILQVHVTAWPALGSPQEAHVSAIRYDEMTETHRWSYGSSRQGRQLQSILFTSAARLKAKVWQASDQRTRRKSHKSLPAANNHLEVLPYRSLPRCKETMSL